MAEPTEAIQHFFEAIIEKRADAIIAHYADATTTYVFVEGPRWSTLGFQHIANGWRAFVAAPLTIQSCQWSEGPLNQTIGNIAWLAGIVELVVQVHEQIKALRLRSTFILVRHEDDAWYIVHEHLSLPANDPYGIGDWLPQGEQN
jgi:ketosteroid isomerase-like protein